MIVDFHTHTFPERIAAAALEKLKHASRTVPFCSGTEEGLRQSMKKAGIDRSVVLPVATNPYKTQTINDLSMRMMEDAELIYFGAIHPDTPQAMAELARIAQAGIKGIKLHPVYQGVNFDDARTLRILEKAGELGMIVLTHAGEDIGYPGVVRVSPEMIARDQAGRPGQAGAGAYGRLAGLGARGGLLGRYQRPAGYGVFLRRALSADASGSPGRKADDAGQRIVLRPCPRVRRGSRALRHGQPVGGSGGVS